MNTIVEQIDSDVCDIIVNKLDLNTDKDNRLLILNNVDSIFAVKIKDHNFVLNISKDNYTKVSPSPYIAKMYKVVKHEGKNFIFYKPMKNRVIDLFKVKLSIDEASTLKKHILQCMEVYKSTFDKDGYFTLDSLLYDKNQITLYSYVNYPHIKTFENIIDATFIKIIMLMISPYHLVKYCETLDPNFRSEFDKNTMYDMINKSEHLWQDKFASKSTYMILMSWLQKRNHIYTLVNYLNVNHGFIYYYPKF